MLGRKKMGYCVMIVPTLVLRENDRSR
ncbi:hypothetical protein EMIT043CA1_260058 [Pseudomonas brassicacearum]